MSQRNEANHVNHAEPVPLVPGRVVIAGGSGFIGRNLTAVLSAAGHRVTVLSRRPRRGDGGVEMQQWHPDGSPATTGAWRETLSGADAVINLCGASLAGGRWTRARKAALINSRTTPSRILVEACNAAESPPAVLLQASGINYYPIGDEERDERAPAGSDFLAQLATAWEAPLRDTDIRTVSLRFGLVMGTGGGALGRMLLPFRLGFGGPLGDGRQWLSWIHVNDAARAILFIMDSPLADAVNVTSPNPVRNREFAACAARTLRRPDWLPIPRLALDALLGEQATLLCDGVKALPARLEGGGFKFLYPRIGDALADLV